MTLTPAFLDELRARVEASRNADDAAYINRLIRIQPYRFMKQIPCQGIITHHTEGKLSITGMQPCRLRIPV